MQKCKPTLQETFFEIFRRHLQSILYNPRTGGSWERGKHIQGPIPYMIAKYFRKLTYPLSENKAPMVALLKLYLTVILRSCALNKRTDKNNT